MNNYNKNKGLFRLSVLAAALSALSAPVSALESLDDHDLSGVIGQDGITMELTAPQLSIDSQTQYYDTADIANPTVGANASSVTMSNISIRPINLDGSAKAGDWKYTLNVDAASIANVPTASVKAAWERGRLAIGEQILAGTAPTVNGLNLVFDNSGKFELVSRGGLFNASQNTSSLLLEFEDANLFIRANDVGIATGEPELILHNADFKWSMPAGIVGIDANGLLLKGDVDFKLRFDLMFDENGATPLAIGTTAQDIPILNFGWEGRLVDATLRAGGGGSWDASAPGSLTAVAGGNIYNVNAATEGLRLRMQWNYYYNTLDDNDPNNFRLIIGEANHGGVYPTNPKTIAAGIAGQPFTPGHLEFGGWKTLPNTTQIPTQPALTTYAYDTGLLIMDMVRAGHGPGGLCWGANWAGPKADCEAGVHGGQYINVDPDDHSLATIQRDSFLRAYASKVKIHDPGSLNADGTPRTTDRVMGWALVSTMGNLDANIFVRPDERAGMNGLKLKGVVMSQTFDIHDVDGDGNTWEHGSNWGYGTHVMIADTAQEPCETTNKCFGIGLMNASLLVAAENLYVNVLKSGPRPGGPAGDTRPGGLSLGDDKLLTASALTNARVRIAQEAQFAGGDVPNMTKQVRISDLKMNLEFDRFHAMFTPPALDGGVLKDTYLGFEATGRLANLAMADFSVDPTGTGPGSFFMLYEPNRPQAGIRISDAQGWLAIRNGRMELKREFETPGDEFSQLSIENTQLFGRSVKNEAGAELKLNRVELSYLDTGGTIGYRNLGSIVIPSGQWYSRTALMPQTR